MVHYFLRKGKFGVTSPLLNTESLPLSPHVTFWGYPPPYPLLMTSFMDGPKPFNKIISKNL